MSRPQSTAGGSVTAVSESHEAPRPGGVPLISTIIPTVGGRPELIDAVRSVLNPSCDVEREVIVVNDSGEPLPEAEQLRALGPVRIVQTGRRRSGGATARNAGAFVARGEFLHFLDDDDRMMDGAITAFATALREHPEADWFYGTTERWSRDGQYIDTLPTALQGNVLAALFCGEWLPLQGSLVRARLFRKAGGFDVSFDASEDMDLLLRMGGMAEVVRIRQPLCRYHLDTSQSVARRDLDGPTLYDAYEKAMDRPSTLRRLRHSAETPHMYGKAVRTYLISVKRHLRRRTAGKLLGRLAETALLLIGAGRFVLVPAFWRAVASSRSGVCPPEDPEKAT